MFSKWKHKQSGTNGETTTSIGGLEKDESDHPRGYRTHLIFAGKRDPEGGAGQNVVSQSGSHYYGAHSTSMSYSSHSNHPFAHAQQQQQIRPHPQPDLSRRKGSRNVMEEDCYRPGSKQVRLLPFLLPSIYFSTLSFICNI